MSEISQMKCMLFHYLVIHSVTPINKPNNPSRQIYVKVINKSTNTSCETCSDYLKKSHLSSSSGIFISMFPKDSIANFEP